MRIIPLTLRAANDFVEAHHRHSARTSNDGGKYAIGLEEEGQLVGAAIVGRPVARLLQDDPLTAELLRCCVSEAAPRCATSKLNARAKRIWQLMGGVRFVSYNLKRESGATMRAVGFREDGEVKARRWDTPSRRRKARGIEEEDKIRWVADMPELPI